MSAARYAVARDHAAWPMPWETREPRIVADRMTLVDARQRASDMNAKAPTARYYVLDTTAVRIT